jgi:plasmid maintenance system antidote protein VapI
MPYKPGKCRLLELLEKRNIPQYELAERIGKTPQRINDYCHNRKMMSMGTAFSISEELGIDMRELYHWEYIPLPAKKRRRNKE